MNCKHDRLTFGSGGFYVFCMDCNAAWVARTRENDEIDYSRSSDGLVGGNDIRVKPEKSAS